MQDGQDDLDGGGFEQPVSGQPVDVQVEVQRDVQRDVHEWLDAAIRASVDTEFGFHKAPPTAAADWPDTQDNTQDGTLDPEQDPQEDPPSDLPRDLDDIAAHDARPAPFTPATAVRLRDRGVSPAPPLRRSLDPVPVPAPRPNSNARQRRPGPLLLYGPVVGGAAVVAYGIAVWGSPQLHNVTAADARPVIVDAQTEAPLAPRLIVHDQHVMTNEPLPLEIAVDRTVPNASLRVAGLALGTHMSAGSAIGDSGWNVPLNGLKNLFMYAPTDFVGVMNSAVDLRGPDEKLIDRRKVKLEWVEPKQQPLPVAPPPAAVVNPAQAPTSDPTLSAEVAASLMQRGQDYLKNGDIASARIVFGRLAAAGVADGAFAAGQTYDSAYLSTHNVMGVGGDEARARTFYQRAVQLGSAEAAAQLARAAAAK